MVSASSFGLAVGNLSANQLRIGSSATTVDHRLIYNSTAGGLFFDLDGSGSNSAVQIAILSTKLTLTNADPDSPSSLGSIHLKTAVNAGKQSNFLH